MPKSLENHVKSLKLVSVSRFEYHSDDFIIKIYPYGALGIYEKRVRVYDIKEMRRLDSYTWHIFSNIEIEVEKEDDLSDDLNYDEYLCMLLSKITVDFPSFFKKKEELDYVDLCERQQFLIPPVDGFSVQDCEVFNYGSISEKMFYRYNTDNRFEIIRISSWHIKYRKSIIEHPYLQSLLPKDTRIVDDERAYSNVFIGETLKSFLKDNLQTENLHNNFSMDKFIATSLI